MRSVIKILVCLVIVSTLLFTIIGCTTSNKEETTVEITDMVGDVVSVKKNPTKVACVSRTSYDLLVAFGLSDSIDGAYVKCLDHDWAQVLYPESANHYKYEYEPSYELLLSRGVDLVLAPEKRISEGLREHGLTALTISLYGTPTFDEYVPYIADMVTKIWDDQDVKQKATEWKNNVQTTISSIQSQIPANENPKKCFMLEETKIKVLIIRIQKDHLQSMHIEH